MPSRSIIVRESVSSDFKTMLQAQLMSLLIFAGAAQLAALTIMGAVGSLSSMYSSTLVISSRHLLYSAVCVS